MCSTEGGKPLFVCIFLKSICDLKNICIVHKLYKDGLHFLVVYKNYYFLLLLTARKIFKMWQNEIFVIKKKSTLGFLPHQYSYGFLSYSTVFLCTISSSSVVLKMGSDLLICLEVFV